MKIPHFFFGTGMILFYKTTMFQLNSDSNYYILGLLDYDSNYNFHLYKLHFISFYINSYTPVVKHIVLEMSCSKIVSCFETKSNYIICFYLDTNYEYEVIVFDENLNSKNFEVLFKNENIFDMEMFYKCVHFKDNAGAFLYYETEENIVVQFKEYDSNGEISNYFNSIQKINLDNLQQYTNIKLSDMIKLDDSKFCFICVKSNNEVMNIIIVNNFSEEVIKIRYYEYRNALLSNYYFGNDLSISLYNGLIAMSSSNYLGTKGENQYVSLIIFGYPNSTDFDFDITENLTNFKNVYINLRDKVKIENNLFGYILYGIKIVDYTDGYLIRSTLRKEQILKGEILINETLITLVLSRSQNIPQNGKIVYAAISTDPDYENLDDYTHSINKDFCGEDNCDKEEEFYKKKLFEGRNSYCNIVINSDNITNICDDENCAVCLSSKTSSCVTCKYLHESNGSSKTCLSENESLEILAGQTTYISKNENNNEVISSTIFVTNSLTTIKTSDENFNDENFSTAFNSPIDSTIYKEKNDSSNTILPIETNLINENEKSQESSGIIENIISNITTDDSKMIESSSLKDLNYQVQSTILENNINLEDIISNVTNNTDNKLCYEKDIIKNKCNDEEINMNKIEEIKIYLLNNTYTTDDNIIIKTKNVIIQLSSLEEQKNSNNINISNIDLGECENKLRESNHIPKGEQLAYLILFRHI